MSTHIESLHSTGLGGFGHSAADDARTAGRRAVSGALAGRVPGAGDLVIIFPSAGYDLEALHRAAAAEAAPASVVGATTVGAFTDDAQLPFGCVAAYIAADGLSFGVCHLERDDADIAGCTRRAAEIARERAGEELEHAVLMLMCDGLTSDQRAMARGAYEVTSSLIPLVGGTAGDDLVWQATYTFGEGNVLSNSTVRRWPRPPIATPTSRSCTTAIPTRSSTACRWPPSRSTSPARVGVADGRLGALRTAAKLHDLGKIGVPDAILNKPASLHADEFRIIQTHPIVGAELLRAWGLDEPARFVLEHHERVDGGGYPDGLCGDAITLEARIIHVADPFVAMTLDRPYRRALAHDEALAEVVRHRAIQFDAAVVDALVALEHPGALPAAA